ncbi:AraC family transcriptional regulator [Butyrivibrio sp. MC2013]|uniref:AraC family transcriptional regulator n=1 Tax=Butyrivibrio sp. MC2013 TaxID=1280686 RepID=UPI0004038546|nr:AraC family transcriptional regulator [Butyrivibrio sp. MC2013]
MKSVDSVILSPTGEVIEENRSPWQQLYIDETMKVVHVNDNSKSSDLYMNYCGTSQCEPDHSFGPAMRDHYVIHYVIGGKGVLTIGSNKYELTKGQGFLLCPGVVSQYKADHDDPWEYVWVGFNGLNAQIYLNQAFLNADNPVFTYDKDDTVKNCMLEMVNTYDAYKYATNLKLQSLLYLLLSELVENATRKAPIERMPLQYRYIQKAISYIQMNYMEEDLSVTGLSDYVGLDRSYLCSIFKKYLNTSPQSYISQYRINRACEILKSTSYPISDVSRMIGYKDPVVFQKFFKNIVGMPPSRYRKSV